jgi:hypothetical protein
MSTKEESPTKKQKCVQTKTVLPPTKELYTELLTELVAKLPEHARILRVNAPLFGADGSFGFGREVLDILHTCRGYKEVSNSPLTTDEINVLWCIILQYKKDIDEYKAAQEKASADIMQDLGILDEGEEEKEAEEINIFGDLEHSVTYIEDCPDGALQGVLERANLEKHHPFKTLPEIMVKLFRLFEMVFSPPTKRDKIHTLVLEHEFDMVIFAMLQEIYPEFLHPDLKGGDDDSEPTQTFILLLEQATEN